MDILIIISFVVLAILAGLVVHGTIVKNRWGINFQRVSCPNCGKEMPRVRVPASGRQAIWGGYTCPNCQCQMDKWGRRLTG